MSHGYKFYIQQVQKNPDGSYTPVDSTTRDLEAYYEGLKYSKLDGVSTVGKAKNIYTEKYADGDRLRVYLPDLVQNEATTLTLTLYFFGKNRQAVFDEFATEIKNGIHRYWDTARQYYFDFYVANELKPTNENWYKGEPFFKVDIKMNNIYGRCFSRTGENLLTDGAKTLNTKDYKLGEYQIGPIKPIDGEKVTFSFSGYLGDGHNCFHIYNSGYSVKIASIYGSDYNAETKRYEATFEWVVGNSANKSIWVYQAGKGGVPSTDENRVASRVYDAKLEIVKTKKI